MIILPGATSQTLQIQIVDDAGLPVTGLVAATFPVTYYQRAGETLPSAISLSDLGAQNSAYSSGGVKELSGGYYRFDAPDAAFATASREVNIIGEATDKRIIHASIQVQNVPVDIQTIKTQTVTCSGGVTVPAATLASTTNITAAAGINVSQINSVSTSSVTVIAANLGTTQPINFQGTSTTAYVKSDIETVLGSAASGSGGLLGVTLFSLQGAALAQFFTSDSGTTYASAVSGSVVKEIVVNAGGSGTTPAAIWDYLTSSISTSGSIGKLIKDDLDAAISSRLAPTVGGRTLDVSTGGEAGLDWANIGSPTTTVGLTGTTIASTQQVDLNTIKTQTVTCSGGVTIPAATLASTTNITAGTITTAVNVTTLNGIAATALAQFFTVDSTKTYADVVAGSVVYEIVSNASGSGASASAVATAVWQDLLSSSDFSTSGSIGKLLKDDVNAAIDSRMATYTQPTGFLAANFTTAFGHLDADVSSRLAPTVGGRTLDVSTGGEAGLDWANVGSPTTSLALTGTTIASTQQVDVNTIKTQTVTCSAGVTVGPFVGNATHAIVVDASGYVSATVITNNDKTGYSLTQSFPSNFSALAITSGGIVQADLQTIKTQTVTCSAGVTVGPFVGNATHAIVADASGFVTVATNNDKTGYSLSQSFPSNFAALAITSGGIVQADLQTIKTQSVVCSGTVTVPAATLASTTNITSAAGVSLTSAYDPAKTAAQAGDAMALTSGERNSIAAALLDLVNGIESGLTLRNAIRLIAAAAAGKLSGAATTTIIIRNAVADSKDRITCTEDVDGNRTAITVDLT